MTVTPRPHLGRLLEEMVEREASDLYLSQGLTPSFRVFGRVVPSTHHPPDREFLMDMVRTVAGEKGLESFLQTGDLDVSYGLEKIGRFRVNIYRQRTGLGAVCRCIPTHVPELDDLHLPPALGEFVDFGHGLVIVTGPTGSGKSTTLASLVKSLADRHPLHILTIENPIEFILESDTSLIVQREVGLHTPSFRQGLRDALREDIDVLMLGELRDLETIRLALQAAEMGMLVFCTLHTHNAAKAISRIVDVFPPEEQSQVQLILADTLRGVLAQQLCLRAEGPGRIAAGELLLGSPSLGYLIREGKSNQILSAIQTGREQGMVTMDQSLVSHYEAGHITLQELHDRAHNQEDLASQGIPFPD
ncbi:MAG: type IV pilus twitching motility protein PilT [Vulcanimicrobiota bacterium]